MQPANPVFAIIAFALFSANQALADEHAAERQSLPTVELMEVLNHVSKKTGKKFLLDARAPVNVVIGQYQPRDFDYPALLTLLRNYGFAAAIGDETINIVPQATIRQHALRLIYEEDESIADNEWVRWIVKTESPNIPVYVPLLRPMVPKAGHIVADPESGTLVLVDHYANARDLVRMIRKMDTLASESPVPTP